MTQKRFEGAIMAVVVAFIIAILLLSSAQGQAELKPFPKFKALDSNGALCSGCKLYAYTAGTTTPLDTYTTAAGNVANTNPVILDSAGEANVWLGSASYKLILKDSNDVQQWSVDNINAAVTGTGAMVRANAPTFTSQTGTGAIVRAASPTITGTLTATTVAASGAVTVGTLGISLLTTVATGTGSISGGSCATVVTAGFSGALTTDVVLANPNADLGSEWQKGLVATWFATANNVNVRVCNPTAGSLTPNALTWNVRIIH